jgi:hypothetical protein
MEQDQGQGIPCTPQPATIWATAVLSVHMLMEQEQGQGVPCMSCRPATIGTLQFCIRTYALRFAPPVPLIMHDLIIFSYILYTPLPHLVTCDS